jgi:hypothetical protein
MKTMAVALLSLILGTGLLAQGGAAHRAVAYFKHAPGELATNCGYYD